MLVPTDDGSPFSQAFSLGGQIYAARRFVWSPTDSACGGSKIRSLFARTSFRATYGHRRSRAVHRQEPRRRNGPST